MRPHFFYRESRLAFDDARDGGRGTEGDNVKPCHGVSSLSGLGSGSVSFFHKLLVRATEPTVGFVLVMAQKAYGVSQTSGALKRARRKYHPRPGISLIFFFEGGGGGIRRENHPCVRKWTRGVLKRGVSALVESIPDTWLYVGTFIPSSILRKRGKGFVYAFTSSIISPLVRRTTKPVIAAPPSAPSVQQTAMAVVKHASCVGGGHGPGQTAGMRVL